MSWYSTLFDDIYRSEVGTKILLSIESTTASDLKGAFQAYLAVRQFERIATGAYPDRVLIDSINKVLVSLTNINKPLSSEDRQKLNEIFNLNGLKLQI